MQEIELKFLVPQASLQALKRQLTSQNSQDIELAAHYYDTPKQALAQAGIGLRIRKEGNSWVQTIKAGGDGMAARLEHNESLDSGQVQAMLDANELTPNLELYKDTFMQLMLTDFKIEELSQDLELQYITNVKRTALIINDSNNSDNDHIKNSIEVAYDYGEIIDGRDASSYRAIEEIEFELVSGNIDFLFTTAKSFCKHYKLSLSTVTKAEQGGLLIKGEHYSRAVEANLEQLASFINEDTSKSAFIRAVVHNCLLHILPNSSAIAAGSEDTQHVLQLHLGMQRLRSALKVFNKFSDQINPEWSAILKQTATLLANYRQLTHLVSSIETNFQQHGAPTVDWISSIKRIKATPIAAVRANDFQLILLELIAFTMSEASAEPKASKLTRAKLNKILSKHYKKTLKAERKLAHLELHSSHGKEQNSLHLEALYKLFQRIENLRNLSEFVAPLYPKKKTKRYLKRLIKAQTALGDYLDDCHYYEYYQQQAKIDPNAWYGAGWFASKLKSSQTSYKKQLKKLSEVAKFW